MKKLALAIGLGVYVLFGASRAALAADVAGGRLTFASRDQSPATAVIGTNSRLLFVNVALYPDTTGPDSLITASTSAHGDQERADMTAAAVIGTNSRLLFVNVALYPDTTDSIITASASAHGEQERADMSQPYTSADRQRLICGDDMCIV